jgi:uncharacterized protein YhfF
MVNVSKRVQPFWDKFQASIAYDVSPLFYEAFHFDDNEATANALAALVLSGQKRAGSSLAILLQRVPTDRQGARPAHACSVRAIQGRLPHV